MNIELLSLDLSNYCSKQCPFCYNHSTKEGNVMWQPQEVINFCCDCIENGVKAVSLGGGEPFEYEGVFEIIDALYPKCYLSVTTNGLPLAGTDVWNKLIMHQPDKIHVSIHNPQSAKEVATVEQLIHRLQNETNIKPGINLLVGADNVDAAKDVYNLMRHSLDADQIIVIPQRFSNTPTPRQLATIAGGQPFQSPSCLLKCKRPENFVSVSWDKRVNSCSYAFGKQQLETLDYAGLMSALEKVQWKSCNIISKE